MTESNRLTMEEFCAKLGIKGKWDDVTPAPALALRTEQDRLASALNLIEIAKTDTLPSLDKDRLRKAALLGRAEYLLNPSNG